MVGGASPAPGKDPPYPARTRRQAARCGSGHEEKGVGFFWVMGSGYAPLVSDSDVRIMSLEVKLVDIRNFNIGRFDSVLSLLCVCE